MNKWHIKFINLAYEISQWSKDPSKKIGVVITDKDNRIISTGFNVFPKGLKDSIERLEDKEFKRAVTLHAEENAILYAKQDLTDCNLYIYGLPPCSHCAAMIIQSGIKNVYYRIPKNYEISEHWKDNLNLAKEILNEVNINLMEL